MQFSSAPLPQIQPFQPPNLAGIANTMQAQSLNAMRERQLIGSEREKNELRRYLADPTIDLTSPDAARRILEVAPTTGPATYQAIMRGYADRRAAEASVLAGAASDRAAALATRQAEAADLDRSIKLTEAFRNMLPSVNAENYPIVRAAAVAAVPRWAPSWPETYDANAVRALMQKADDSLKEHAERNKPPEDFTLSPGQTRFSGTGQPIATVDARDPAREVKIRSIMETQNVPLQIAAGIVDGVLRPIQDPVSGQTRLFNLANNTFVEFTPAGTPAPAAPVPAPMATGPRVGVTPPVPAPMATGPRVGVAPPPNAMVAEPANAMLALPGAAAQPNIVQLPTYAAPTTRPEADYQKRVLDLMADLEKQRIENLRARTARREDAAAIAAEEADKARGVAQAQADVRGSKPPPPTGQRYNAEGRLEDIPGSERERAAAERRGAQVKAATVVTESIDRILDRLNTSLLPVTGFGAPTMAALMSGSPAADVGELRKTIESNISFETLTEMRRQSPTGGALGNVTDKDLELLKTSLGSLNQNQSPRQFRENLMKLRDRFLETIHGPNFRDVAPPPPQEPAPERLPGRRGAPLTGNRPTLEQFLERARPANPNASTEDLTSYYNRTYGGR